jgi:hypothetical protein
VRKPKHLEFYRQGIARAMPKIDSKRKLVHMILRKGKQYITIKLTVIIATPFPKLMLFTFAPFAAARLVALATSLSHSPLDTVRTDRSSRH